MEKSTISQPRLIANCYATYREELVNFAASHLGSHEEGEDLVQDAFVKMMTYEGMISETTVKSFAFTITANRVKDELRRRIFRRRMENETMCEMGLPSSSTDCQVIYHETRLHLERVITTLAPACARIYRMSLLDDMATGDIARELNISKRTAETQLNKARRQVRNCMLREA